MAFLELTKVAIFMAGNNWRLALGLGPLIASTLLLPLLLWLPESPQFLGANDLEHHICMYIICNSNCYDVYFCDMCVSYILQALRTYWLLHPRWCASESLFEKVSRQMSEPILARYLTLQPVSSLFAA